MLALAGLLFTACSDNDAVVGNDPKPGEVLPEGYVALNINLPTTSGTRAENDDFADGLSTEYYVNDCALLFFQGTKEDDATFLCAQSFTAKETSERGDDTTFEDGDTTKDDNDKDGDLPKPDGITTSYLLAAQISGLEAGKNLYAVAALNYSQFMEVTATGEVTIKKDLTNPSENVTLSKTMTFNDIRKYVAKTTLNNRLARLIGQTSTTDETPKYFFMTNAVMSVAPGGKTSNKPAYNDIFQLAQLNPMKVYATPDLARRNPAGEIFVERIAAKATLNLASTNNVMTDGINGLKVTSITWAIDNMEPDTYIFRYPGTESDQIYWDYTSASNATTVSNQKYRFISGASTLHIVDEIDASERDYYRTYWCFDPHYTDASVVYDPENTTNNTMLPATTSAFGAIGQDKPQYCTENTFNVLAQSYKNTTRAIIKVKVEYEDEQGETQTEFYSINNNQTIYTESDVKSHLETIIIEDVNVRIALNEALKEGQSYDWENGDNYEDYFEFVYIVDNNTNKLTIDEVRFKAGTKFEDSEDLTTALSTVVEHVNSDYVVYKYSGEMYYEARFMHFGDELTPWDADEYGDPAPAGGSTAAAYPANGSTTAEMNYLGRYGMVRNNWYDVEITEFTKFGSPTNPAGKFENPNTPDDDLKDNIAVRIHVLSWAKRGQQWGF